VFWLLFIDEGRENHRFGIIVGNDLMELLQSQTSLDLLPIQMFYIEIVIPSPYPFPVISWVDFETIEDHSHGS